jgi:hypothetical protein
MATMAKSIAGSKMFGIANEDQAMALMLLCQAEGIHPIMALRRYHIIEGKPAMRADALQGEFERDGAILWHERDEKMCGATFFRDKTKVDDKAIERAKKRYEAISKGNTEAPYAAIGEMTIVRTLADAIEKKLAMSYDQDRKEWKMKKNWRQSPRQMLHWRCLTEGVRAMNPGLVAGVYTEDEVLDMQPSETYDQRPVSEVAERNVKEATANATHGVVKTDTGVRIDPPDHGTYGPKVVTKDNYKDRISHIGKAEGRILGRKVGEMEPPVIKWMFTKWREGLQPSATDDDMQLKKAIEFAHEDLSSNVENAPTDTNPRRGNVDSGSTGPESGSSAPPAHSDIGAKQAAITDLLSRFEDLAVTEEVGMKYMIQFGLANEGWTKLDQMPENILLYLCTPQGWGTWKEHYNEQVKPTVSPPIPAKRGRKKK